MTDLHALADTLRAAAAAYCDGDTELLTGAEYDDGIEQLSIAATGGPGSRQPMGRTAEQSCCRAVRWR